MTTIATNPISRGSQTKNSSQPDQCCRRCPLEGTPQALSWLTSIARRPRPATALNDPRDPNAHLFLSRTRSRGHRAALPRLLGTRVASSRAGGPRPGPIVVPTSRGVRFSPRACTRARVQSGERSRSGPPRPGPTTMITARGWVPSGSHRLACVRVRAREKVAGVRPPRPGPTSMIIASGWVPRVGHSSRGARARDRRW